LKEEDRLTKHKRSEFTESMLEQLKLILEPANTIEISSKNFSSFPVIHVLGCARSGTTLLQQLLVKHLQVCYPTNFMSRFYFAPHVGAMFQYLMNDLDYKEENLSALDSFRLTSKLGKTKGPLAPNEFWYFWRRKFEVDENGWITNVNNDVLSDFYHELDSITSVFSKPMVMKSLIAQNEIRKFLDFRPEDKVVFIKRDVVYNAQSLILARKEFYGDINRWYSFIPPNYQNSKSPYSQVVQQVRLTNKLIEDQLEGLCSNRVFTVNYEELGLRLGELIDWTGVEKGCLPSADTIELKFNNSQQLQDESFDKLVSASLKYQAF
jgi:hypothetical protein